MTYEESLMSMERGKYYHVYNRGNNRETIFKESLNYQYFLELWAKYIDPIAETICYNLLPNHFHFFIRLFTKEELEEKISKIENPTQQQLKKFRRVFLDPEQHFSNLFNAYAKALNKRHLRVGSLFQKRFKRKEIDSTIYFTVLVAYILTNAVKHGISDNLDEYPWSSYQDLVQATDKNPVIKRFGDKAEFLKYLDIYRQHLNFIRLTSEMNK
ncbi:hypothetical protein [Pollutibacter soli]|uniref:hypothetical protein n=1 Tax=Pollutibacter soli TaxID=3034157 RepID=UPI00301402AA